MERHGRKFRREQSHQRFDYFRFYNFHVWFYIVNFPDLPTLDFEAIKSNLSKKNITFVVTRDLGPDQRAMYFSTKVLGGQIYLVELKFKSGMNVCKITVKAANKQISEAIKGVVEKILL